MHDCTREAGLKAEFADLQIWIMVMIIPRINPTFSSPLFYVFTRFYPFVPFFTFLPLNFYYHTKKFFLSIELFRLWSFITSLKTCLADVRARRKRALVKFIFIFYRI